MANPKSIIPIHPTPHVQVHSSDTVPKPRTPLQRGLRFHLEVAQRMKESARTEEEGADAEMVWAADVALRVLEVMGGLGCEMVV